MTARDTVQLNPLAAAVAFALAKGVEMAEVTEVTGLGYEDLIQPSRRVDSLLLGRVFELLGRRFPGEAVGLQMARVAPFSFFGVLEHVAGYAEELRGTIEVWVRYHKLVATDLEMGFEQGPAECLLWWRHPNDQRAPSPIPPEVVVGLATRFLREVLAIEGAVARVEFTHPPTAALAVYREFFEVPVRFEAPRNGIVIFSSALERRAGQADRRRYDYLVEHLSFLEEQLAEEREHAELRRIRAAVLSNARRGEYSAEALAKRLGMSLRSLQRVAKAHGRQLREILDEVREQHARRLLKDPRLSVEEIAFLLGYSAESAFRRAFKRWSGQSPAALRRA